jgi:hypothetical protein
MFNSKDWFYNSRNLAKTFTKEDFRTFDLNGNVEYGDTYNDIFYARQIFTKMGYKVGIGMAFHVYDYSKKTI